MASGAGEAGFEFSDPDFQSLKALSELAHVISAVPRCSGSGRGPIRSWGRLPTCRACMSCSLGRLHCRRDLCVRGREQASDLLGHRLVRGQSGKLGLPKIEVTPGQLVEVGTGIGAVTGSLVVVFRSHDRTIADRIAGVV